MAGRLLLQLIQLCSEASTASVGTERKLRELKVDLYLQVQINLLTGDLTPINQTYRQSGFKQIKVKESPSIDFSLFRSAKIVFSSLSAV